jgi:hypothetical protein
MNYIDIKDFTDRCETHPDHQSGMVTERDIQHRLAEEIDELRAYIENGLAEGWIYEVENT